MRKAVKLTEAQRRKLASAPDEWAEFPLWGDHRPIPPLLRMALVEERRTDVTPADWPNGHIRLVRHEWRITDAGRQALTEGGREP